MIGRHCQLDYSQKWPLAANPNIAASAGDLAALPAFLQGAGPSAVPGVPPMEHSLTLTRYFS